MGNAQKIKRSPLDWMIESLALLGLLGCFYPLLFYADLPDKIPKHFNSRGEVDSWGDPAILWPTALVVLISYCVLSLLQRVIRLHNFRPPVSEANLPKVRRFAARAMGIIKLLIVLICGYINYQTYSIAIGRSETGLGEWLTPLALFLIPALPVCMAFGLARK